MKMIKIMHRNLPGVSNMADQGRIILQNYCVCNLSIPFHFFHKPYKLYASLIAAELETDKPCRLLTE